MWQLELIQVQNMLSVGQHKHTNIISLSSSDSLCFNSLWYTIACQRCVHSCFAVNRAIATNHNLNHAVKPNTQLWFALVAKEQKFAGHFLLFNYQSHGENPIAGVPSYPPLLVSSLCKYMTVEKYICKCKATKVVAVLSSKIHSTVKTLQYCYCIQLHHAV